MRVLFIKPQFDNEIPILRVRVTSYCRIEPLSVPYLLFLWPIDASSAVDLVPALAPSLFVQSAVSNINLRVSARAADVSGSAPRTIENLIQHSFQRLSQTQLLVLTRSYPRS